MAPAAAPETGTMRGHPFVRLGSGPRTLLVAPGLQIHAGPPGGSATKQVVREWGRHGQAFTIWHLGRRPGGRRSLKQMADEYAEVIEGDLGRGPVDVYGLSTGGSIVQYLAADHPQLVRRLVLSFTAAKLAPRGAELQRHVADLVRQGRTRRAYAEGARALWPKHSTTAATLAWALGPMLAGRPDVETVLNEIEGEDAHDAFDRLGDIRAPTLVQTGELDDIYGQDLVRETAEGIGGARLIVYPGVGHLGPGAKGTDDAVAFLLDDPGEDT